MIQMQDHVHPNDWSDIELTVMDLRSRSPGKKGVSQESSVGDTGIPVKRAEKFEIVKGLQPKQANSVAIDQDGTDYSYICTIQVGASGKAMQMLIDTGAANTWIMGSDCSSEPCLAHNTFGAKDSTSLRVTDTEFSLAYGSGTVSGMIFNDTLKMADFSIPLSFGSASIVSNEFSFYPMDGILGLGRSASSNVEAPTFMEAIDSRNVLSKNLLGIHLQRNIDGSTDGELNFGSPNTNRYTGDVSYTSTVKSSDLWEISIDDAAVNGVKCSFSGKTAIIDTGTSFLLLPPGDAQRIHKLIPSSQQEGEIFNVPCSASVPVQIIISKITYNIPPKDYLGKPVPGGTLCESKIIGKDTFGPDRWLVGDVFLKNVYTIFDFDEDKIGHYLVLLPYKIDSNLFRTGFGVKVSPSPSLTTSRAISTSSVGSTVEPSPSTTTFTPISPLPISIIVPAITTRVPSTNQNTYPSPAASAASSSAGSNFPRSFALILSVITTLLATLNFSL